MKPKSKPHDDPACPCDGCQHKAIVLPPDKLKKLARVLMELYPEGIPLL